MQGMCNYVDIGGQPITGPEGLSEALKGLEGGAQSMGQGIQLYETDHVLAPEGMTIAALLAHQKASRPAVAVLYGAPGTPGFKEMHSILMQVASSGTCTAFSLPYHVHQAQQHPGRTNFSSSGLSLALQRISCQHSGTLKEFSGEHRQSCLHVTAYARDLCVCVRRAGAACVHIQAGTAEQLSQRGGDLPRARDI